MWTGLGGQLRFAESAARKQHGAAGSSGDNRGPYPRQHEDAAVPGSSTRRTGTKRPNESTALASHQVAPRKSRDLDPWTQHDALRCKMLNPSETLVAESFSVRMSSSRTSVRPPNRESRLSCGSAPRRWRQRVWNVTLSYFNM